MNLHVLHDARMLASLTGAAQPTCDGVILRHGDMAGVVAMWLSHNPLDGRWLADVEAASPGLMTWSGTLADSLFEADPRTWLAPGQNALAAFCNEVAPQLARHHRRLCFLPHARHVLNDAPSCLKFLRDRTGQPFEIALAPSLLLEHTMQDRLEEHLARMFESLGDRCAMVLLSDAPAHTEVEQTDAGLLELGTGVLPRATVRSLLAAHVPAETPIVIDGRGGGQSIRRQIDWLRG